MEWKFKFNGRNRQFLSTVVANFHTMVYCVIAIWPSPTLPVLLSEDSPLPSGSISIFDASLISSILYFGGILGTLNSGFIAKRLGPKRTIIFSAIPEIAAALCIMFAQNVYYLHISRFLSGIASGAQVLIPAYVCEVSEDCIRGMLGSILGIVDCLGVLLGVVVGSYMSFYQVPYVMIVLSCLSLFFVFFPESPQFLLLRQEIPQAEESLKFFRQGLSVDKISEEFNRLKESIVDADATKKEMVTLKDFKSPATVKALIICIVIFTGRQASGIGTIINYNGLIFKETGMEMDPNLGTITMAIVQLLSFSIMTLCIDRFGRRLQLIGSLMGTFISYLPIGIYFHMKYSNFDVTSFSGWLPLVAFSGVAIFSMGLIHTPTIICTEILPAKLRGTCVLMIFLLTRVQSILMMQFFLPVVDQFGLHTCLFFFASWTLFEAIFIFFYLPETKGRSVDDIVKNMNVNSVGSCKKPEC